MISLCNGEIADIMPENLKGRPEVRAIGYAIKRANQKMLENMKRSMVYAEIDFLPEKVLDVLSMELRAQYYVDDLEIEKKRTIIKNTLFLHTKAGTPSAVETMIDYVFGSGELVEWFQSGGEPGTFEINTTADIDVDVISKFKALIDNVKNIRSHLVAVNLGIRTETKLYMGMKPVIYGKTVIR